MSIRVSGSDLKFSSQMIIDKCIASSIRDTQGRPFKIISLTRTPFKIVSERTRDKSALAENTMIVRTNRNIVIQTPPQDPISGKKETMGNIEWIRDEFTKQMIAKIADTPNNRMLLATRYYDKLEKIDDPAIEMEIKKMADKIDEDNKKIPYTWEQTTKTTDPKTGIKNFVSIPVTGTYYDFTKYRRENQFNVTSGNTTMSPSIVRQTDKNYEEKYLNEIERLTAEIKKLKEITVIPENNIEENCNHIGVEKTIDDENYNYAENWDNILEMKLPRLKKILIKLGISNRNAFAMNKQTALSTIAKMIGIEYGDEKKDSDQCQQPVIM